MATRSPERTKMADKPGLTPPPDRRSRLQELLAPDANLRISRTPINIWQGDTSGAYKHPSSPDGERIYVSLPEAGSGMDAMGAIKHEAVHQFFNKYPDADKRMMEKMGSMEAAGLPQGDLLTQRKPEWGPHSLVHLPDERIPDEFAKYAQQAMMDSAQGPEQQRHMKALLSLIPPEAITQQLKDRATMYYGSYYPDIQRSLRPQVATPVPRSILDSLLGR